ncbi:MAG: hypothetical protein Q4G43_16685 [Mobilicoccus sp.]|nr:hypothetical protein [Mobilicoccus sp.]
MWFRKIRSAADTAARSVDLGKGDGVMAAATDTLSGGTIVATKHELLALTPDGEQVWRRRWLDVDAGSWENTTGTISVTWVDGGQGAQWTFGRDERRFAEVFRDRVEASRVIDVPVDRGERTIARAAIRKDLSSGELVPQVMYTRAVRRGDEDARARAEAALAGLREQVGI